MTARSSRLDATPPEHSTGRPGQRFLAASVARRTAEATVSRANRAISAGGFPCSARAFTLFSMPERENVRSFSFTENPDTGPLSAARASRAFPAGKSRPSSTPVRSMSCPAEISLVPPIFSARTFHPSGSTYSSSVVPPDRCQASMGPSSSSMRPADQAAAATCPCWWEAA